VNLPLAFAAIALINLSSCDRVRKLAGSVGKKERSPTTAPANLGPLVVEIPDGGFDTFVLQENRLVIIDFTADWCGPCRQLAPLLDKITKENQGVVVVGKIDVDRFPTLATREGVKNIPDIRIYRSGRLVEKFIGLRDESEVRQMVETHIKGLSLAALVAQAGKTPQATTQPMTKDWMPPGLRRR
jgi:thioredoxin 1